MGVVYIFTLMGGINDDQSCILLRLAACPQLGSARDWYWAPKLFNNFINYLMMGLKASSLTSLLMLMLIGWRCESIRRESHLREKFWHVERVGRKEQREDKCKVLCWGGNKRTQVRLGCVVGEQPYWKGPEVPDGQQARHDSAVHCSSGNGKKLENLPVMKKDWRS